MGSKEEESSVFCLFFFNAFIVGPTNKFILNWFTL